MVHKPTRRSAKLHFLTREAMQIKQMLTRYSEAVLQVRLGDAWRSIEGRVLLCSCPSWDSHAPSPRITSPRIVSRLSAQELQRLDKERALRRKVEDQKKFDA